MSRRGNGAQWFAGNSLKFRVWRCFRKWKNDRLITVSQIGLAFPDKAMVSSCIWFSIVFQRWNGLNGRPRGSRGSGGRPTSSLIPSMAIVAVLTTTLRVRRSIRLLITRPGSVVICIFRVRWSRRFRTQWIRVPTSTYWITTAVHML